MRTINLLFSDTDFGTHEWGFIPRKPDPYNPEDASDSEDFRYQRHLARLGISARVVGGVIRVPCNSSPAVVG